MDTMIESQRYNGWTNYETWNVKLWIDNDQGERDYWFEQAREMLDSAEPEYDWETKRGVARTALAKALDQEIRTDRLPEGVTTGVYADLLNAALSSVNWNEIAENILEEIEG